MSTDPSMPPQPAASAPSPAPGPAPAPNAAPLPVPAAAAPAAKKSAETTSFLGYFFLGRTRPGEIVVFRHTNLFYWWPVWALGTLMALITFFGNRHMAIVPAGTVATTAESGEAKVDDKTIDISKRDVLLLPEKSKHLTRKDNGQETRLQPTIYMSQHKGLGSVFSIVLLLVIVITNVQMRGLWSFLILIVIVALAAIFWVAGWWDNIMASLGQLSIHINLGGYILISGVLFLMWLVNFTIFDRQTYMIFTAGQVRMRLEVGGGETVFDTTGMVVQKQRGDLFRHWILGFGSGDLIIRPQGKQQIEMPNVMRVAMVVKRISQLVKEKVIVQK